MNCIVQVRMHPTPAEYIDWLQPYPEQVRNLSIATRNSIVSRAPDATEIVADACNSVAMCLTYTSTHVKSFVHIATGSDHVNFGFTCGASLPDRLGRLAGSGKQIRHMKLWKLEDLDDPYLWEMFDEAHNRAFRPDPPLARQTLFMLYENAKKRRPVLSS